MARGESVKPGLVLEGRDEPAIHCESRFSGVQALDSSQLMSGAEEMLPDGTTTAKHRTELRKTLGDLL